MLLGTGARMDVVGGHRPRGLGKMDSEKGCHRRMISNWGRKTGAKWSAKWKKVNKRYNNEQTLGGDFEICLKNVIENDLRIFSKKN